MISNSFNQAVNYFGFFLQQEEKPEYYEDVSFLQINLYAFYQVQLSLCDGPGVLRECGINAQSPECM